MKDFDNVLLRRQRNACLIASARNIHQLGYWPDGRLLLESLGLPGEWINGLEDSTIQHQFLNALSEQGGMAAFKPKPVGFVMTEEDFHHREKERAQHIQLIFNGKPPHQIWINAIHHCLQRLSRGGHLSVVIKNWNFLETWHHDQSLLRDLISVTSRRRQIGITAFIESDLSTYPERFWNELYDTPWLRVRWISDDLVTIGTQDELLSYCRTSLRFKHLSELADHGVWLDAVVPVSNCNVSFLALLVERILEATRGGTIRLVPVSFMQRWSAYEGPDPAIYSEALHQLYENKDIPSDRIDPLAWVLQRINRDNNSISCCAGSLGSAITITPNGNLYAGEETIGNEAWFLGSITEDNHIVWETRLDAIAERESRQSKPERCQYCDWRFRCGGVCCQVLRLINETRPNDEQTNLFELYCQPRLKLFERIVWDYAQTQQYVNQEATLPRERLILSEEGIDYEPVLSGTRENQS